MRIKSILTLSFVVLMLGTAFAQRKANKQYELKAFNLAIKSYIRYINQNPSNGESMARLADCYRHLNQLQDAVEWYERAMSTPQNIDPIHYLYYGQSLMGMGNYSRAAEWFKRYAQINPEVGRHFADMATFAERQGRQRSDYEIQNVTTINTSTSDFGAAFYDQNKLVISSSRTDGEQSSNWSGRAKNRLFVAEPNASGALELKSILNKDSNAKKSEGPISYASNGRLAAITQNNFVDGTRHISSSGLKLDLYMAQVDPRGDWTEGEAFPYNNTDHSTGFAHLAADGNTLFFASDRPGGQGGFDLYVSYRTSATWSTPENLGPSINTPGDEITPYFDGRNLYFSSEWHRGLGGYDVFRSEKTNGQWSRPESLGVGVNSPRDDYAFIYDGIQNIGYFTSNRPDGSGSEDIYQVRKRAEDISITVLNATDRRPLIGATIDFSDCGLINGETRANGVYSFPAPDGMRCRVLVRKQGYLTSSLELSTLAIPDSRNYEFLLRREGEDYVGFVLDGTSNSPVEGVRIIANNQNTGQDTEGFSNVQGEYVLALSPNAMYTIRYSKPGYSDINRSLPTGTGVDRSILGTFPIQRTDAFTNSPPTDEFRERTGTETPTGAVPAFAYAIQIAAVKRLEEGKYDVLTQYGNVYYISANDFYKVRVGAFVNKADASDMLKQVKSDGHQGAFIVEEEGQLVRDKLIGVTPTTNPIETPVADVWQERNGTIADVPPVTNPSAYKIQLGAYSKPQTSFRDGKIKHLGSIEQRKKGNLTVMYISGFNTASEAKQALSSAKKAGFPGAFVVEDNGSGDLIRVR